MSDEFDAFLADQLSRLKLNWSKRVTRVATRRGLRRQQSKSQTIAIKETHVITRGLASGHARPSVMRGHDD